MIELEAKPVHPLDPSERIAVVDSLRGLALFGVLAINLEREFRVSIFENLLARSQSDGMDRVVDALLTIFIDLKAFAVFSLLFGIGLAIQHERLKDHPARLKLLIRRLLALLTFGLIHLYLIWNGDVLAEYAIAALVALPFLYARTQWLVMACAASMILYIAQPLFPPVVSLLDSWLMQGHVRTATEVYSSGGFLDILRFRIQEVPLIFPLHVYIFPRTLGLFLLGIIVWRMRLIQDAHKYAGYLQWLAFNGIMIGVMLTLTTTAGAFTGWRWRWSGASAFMVESGSTVILAVGYASLVVALYRLQSARRWLEWVAPLGRMAFTNYVAQSILLGWIFYGYGLGAFGRIGLTAGLALVILIFLGQLIISKWWLAHFKFGPLEWLWRVVMYGRFTENKL